MTEYVLFHPGDDEVLLVAALVDKPILVLKSQAERTVRRLALERQLAELDREEGIERPDFTGPWSPGIDDPLEPLVPDEPTRRYAGTFTGADGVRRTELHHTEQRPGPQFVCQCDQAFYDEKASLVHMRSCVIHQRFVADPRYEVGAFVQGGREKHPLR